MIMKPTNFLMAVILLSQLITSLAHAMPIHKRHGHFFRLFDTDTNQQVDKDEFIKARNLRFKTMDTDTNGIVSQSEFMAYVKTKHLKYKMDKYNTMDANQDGMVSKKEYLAAKLILAEQQFKKQDNNGDGLLSVEESTHFKWSKHKKRNYFFKKMDANSDGEISLTENQQVTDRWFSRLDLNRDGTITQGEIKAMHRQLQENR